MRGAEVEDDQDLGLRYDKLPATIHRVKFMTTYWVSQGVVDILNILLRMLNVLSSLRIRVELKDNTKLLLFLQSHIILRYNSISKISIQRRNNKQPCLKTIGFKQPWRFNNNQHVDQKYTLALL